MGAWRATDPPDRRATAAVLQTALPSPDTGL
jgi:hypothetical protein